MPLEIFEHFYSGGLLRLTPANCQNDPFEFGYTKKQISSLNKHRESLGDNVKEFATDYHGIVSLSLCNNNILMWTHYADSHRGVVIEFIVNKQIPEKLLNNSYPTSRYKDILTKPMGYKKRRHSNINKLKSQSDITNIRHHYYFTKAKEWEYEKEYRYILPFDWVSSIIITNEEAKDEISSILGTDKDIIGEHEGDIYKIPHNSVDYLKGNHPEVLKSIWLESHKHKDTVIFLTQIDTSNLECRIGNLYLGVNTDRRKLKGIIETLDSPFEGHFKPLVNSNYKNILEAKIDSEKYKINFAPFS